MEYDYEVLLKRARSQLPQVTSGWERLEVPTPQYNVVGTRTTIHNFRDIAETLNREPQHLLKFLSGELATAATLQESRAIFQGKFPKETLERLIQRYIETFVVCPVCKRPDTKIVKEKRLAFLLCEACGAKSSIRSI